VQKPSEKPQEEPIAIQALPIDNTAPVDQPTQEITEPTPVTKTPISQQPPVAMRPQYTIQELAVYRKESQDIERLFSRAEQSMGKLLTYNDMNVVFGFYDWLRLPIEVIEYLLSYCAENEQRSLRYMERVALDWADHGIDDLEKAMTYVQKFDRNYRSILKHLGQLSGYPTPAQRKYMDTWLNDWGMPLDVILLACDKASESPKKNNFKYVDSIVSAWHKDRIGTVEDAVKAMEAFNREKTEASRKMATKAKPNGFANFKQREYDFKKLEKLEQAYLLQNLKG